MEEKTIDPQESMEIIRRMVETAKQEIRDNGFFYLLWGWLVFIAAALHFIWMQAGYQRSYLPWMVMMPAGALVSVIYSFTRKKKQQKKAKSWVEDIFKYTWIAFGVSLGIVLFMAGRIGWEVVYPMLIILYGIGTFISGGIMKFKPLIIGGIMCWVLAVVAFYMDFDVQLVLLAAAILVSYIIPGHILKYQYKHA